ncbi:hypothetical protein [Clostridium sp. UBA6640]|uniref:hypothetical protein n=1 Tax=Clostridium sp. UBA6640 TaxID=1946370 RepID=UPI0025BC59D2|nr:hypothetical protein [Clostridium sp. UBA6640]
MVKRKRIVSFLIMAIVIINFNIFLSQAKERVDVFNEVLSITNSKIVEASITTTFKSNKDYDYYYKNLLLLLREYTTSMEEKTIYDNSNYREFKFDNIYGYIEKVCYKDETLITINLVEKTNENKLEDLKGVLDKILLEHAYNVQYYLQIKSMLEENDLETVNCSIINALENRKTTGLSTVNLNNGYSTICNTKNYIAKRVNDELIDFQFAVVRYSSGNYLIMGTPEITLTF